MSLARDFRPQAVEDESLPPAKETPEEVERRFWRNVNLRPPLYGADVPGSLFDEDLKVQQPCLCSQQTQEQPVAAQIILQRCTTTLVTACSSRLRQEQHGLDHSQESVAWA